MNVLTLFLMTLLFVLSGCSNVNKESLKPSLGDIKAIQPAIEYKPIDISQVDLIKSYRALLKIANEEEKNDGTTLKRLSDISLEHSIDDLLSEDEVTINRGKSLSREAILGYKNYLLQFPNKSSNGQILYQLAKAYDINGDIKEAFNTLMQLNEKHPNFKYISEVKFRIAEYYFSNGVYPYAKEFYKAVIDRHPESKFYRNSLYKYAWSLIKNNENEASVYAFLKLMDLHYQEGDITKTEISVKTSDSKKALIVDILRAINLAISYDLEKVTINHYFKPTKKPYEALIYQSLAQFLYAKNRINDAAGIYFSFLEDNPPSYTSFKLFNKGVSLLRPSPFTEFYLKSKKAIVTIFSKPSIFTLLEANQKEVVGLILAKHNYELAKHYHSLAQKSNNRQQKNNYYQLTEKWYSLFLKRFSGNKRYGEVSFLLAESYTERGLFLEAAKQYGFSSYQIKRHKQSKESGYAAVLSYQSAIESSKNSDEKYQIQQQLIDSSINYRAHYMQDKRSDKIIFNASSLLYNDKRYDETLAVLLPILNNKKTSPWLLAEATVLTGHVYFNSNDYINANKYYLKALDLVKSKPIKKRLRTKIAESYYQLAIQANAKNKYRSSAKLYLLAYKTAPSISVKKISLYDAATQYLIAEDWAFAIPLLKQFQQKYKSDKKLYRGSQEKLALAYRSSGNTKQAATSVLALANNSNKQEKQALLWEAATLFKKLNQPKQYLKIYDDYARLYPLPLERSLSARLIIADSYLANNKIKSQKSWLKSIISSEHKHTLNSNQDANKIAANASLALADYALADYKKITLTVPLKESLAKKKKALKATIKQFSSTLKYADPHTQTLATYGLGEIYRDFASSLLNSERPKKLNEEELEEYGYLLEDQAFPFEEKAIKIHRNNFAKTHTGLYTQGIKNSQKSLAELLPFQYNKHEIATPYVLP